MPFGTEALWPGISYKECGRFVSPSYVTTEYISSVQPIVAGEKQKGFRQGKPLTKARKSTHVPIRTGLLYHKPFLCQLNLLQIIYFCLKSQFNEQYG